MPLKPEISISALAYAAGLIDGEGSIGGASSVTCRTNYRVILSVSMCDREGVDFLSEIFGGKVSIRKTKTRTGKTIYCWAVYCRNAAGILSVLLPYLKVKRKKAELAIRLAGLMGHRGTAKMRVLPFEEVQERHFLAAALRKANFETNGRLVNHAVASQ